METSPDSGAVGSTGAGSTAGSAAGSSVAPATSVGTARSVAPATSVREASSVAPIGAGGGDVGPSDTNNPAARSMYIVPPAIQRASQPLPADHPQVLAASAPRPDAEAYRRVGEEEKK